jgi:hypothetical protein
MTSVNFYFLAFDDRSFNTLLNKAVNKVFSFGKPFQKYTHVVMTLPNTTFQNCVSIYDNYNGGTLQQCVEAAQKGTALDTLVIKEETDDHEHIHKFLLDRYPTLNGYLLFALEVSPETLRKIEYLINYAPSIRIEFLNWLLIRLKLKREAPVYTCNYNVIQFLKLLGIKSSFAATIPETMIKLQTQELS